VCVCTCIASPYWPCPAILPYCQYLCLSPLFRYSSNYPHKILYRPSLHYVPSLFTYLILWILSFPSIFMSNRPKSANSCISAFFVYQTTCDLLFNLSHLKIKGSHVCPLKLVRKFCTPKVAKSRTPIPFPPSGRTTIYSVDFRPLGHSSSVSCRVNVVSCDQILHWSSTIVGIIKQYFDSFES